MIELCLEGYLLGEDLNDWNCPGVRGRAEIGLSKHFEQNHWNVKKTRVRRNLARSRRFR